MCYSPCGRLLSPLFSGALSSLKIPPLPTSWCALKNVTFVGIKKRSFIEFIGVTLVYKAIHVSSVQLNKISPDTLGVPITQSSLFLSPFIPLCPPPSAPMPLSLWLSLHYCLCVICIYIYRERERYITYI